MIVSPAPNSSATLVNVCIAFEDNAEETTGRDPFPFPVGSKANVVGRALAAMMEEGSSRLRRA